MSRRNGILAAPDRLTDLITDYGMAGVALTGRWKAVMQVDPHSPLSRAISEDIERIRKLRIRPVKTPHGAAYEFKVNTDLSDLSESYPKERMQALNPKIQIRLLTRPAAPVRTISALFAGWVGTGSSDSYERTNIVVLNLPTIDAEYTGPLTMEGYRQLRRGIRRATAHELRHFVQASLADATGSPREGVTFKRIQEIRSIGLHQYTQGGRFLDSQGSSEAYATSLVEYFPWIGDWLDITRAYVDQQNRPMVLSDFNDSLPNSNEGRSVAYFRDALKEADPARYRRILQEQATFMQDYNDAYNAARKGPKRPLTPQRVVSELLLDLDVVDSERAAYLRAHRDAFIAFAAENMK